jgi:hypothetical protein
VPTWSRAVERPGIEHLGLLCEMPFAATGLDKVLQSADAATSAGRWRGVIKAGQGFARFDATFTYPGGQSSLAVGFDVDQSTAAGLVVAANTGNVGFIDDAKLGELALGDLKTAAVWVESVETSGFAEWLQALRNLGAFE